MSRAVPGDPPPPSINDLEAFVSSNDPTVRMTNNINPARGGGGGTPRTPLTMSRKNSMNPSPFASRSQSPTTTSTDSSDIPSNVCRVEQLDLLPDECLSGDKDRPLRHFDENGNSARYSLNPVAYAAIFVLLVEVMERLSFYGLNYTQASYLTGMYDVDWNAGMEAIPASTYVSVSVAVAYSTPFMGVILEQILGDYRAILAGCCFFYLPGLLLIALTSVPHLLGESFNTTALSIGLLVLWPTGTGIVKSLVNVFGARQFHPLLQSSLIEAFYVQFYMCINIGALIGGIVVPIMAQTNVSMAYGIPVITLSCGVALFIMGSQRYVKSPPSVDWDEIFGKKKKRKAILLNPSEQIPLSVMLRVCSLVIPFNIAYSQMATTFILQGNVMQKAFGWIDAASMNNADAVAVLVFGYVIGNLFYPWCAERNIKIPTTYKFAIGSFLGAAAIAWALMVEYMIQRRFLETGKKLSIMWQAMAYILIGIGEIFAVSAAYEVAFTASPPDKKVISSAVNLFCIGGIPNIICVGLYQACHLWFRNSRGTANISRVEDYVTANVSKYFWLLFWISIAGTLLNLLPPVREFVESVEEQAIEMIRTPKTPARPPIRSASGEDAELLLNMKRHQYYLKYGNGPSLCKMGTLRAGANMMRSQSVKAPKVNRKVLATLYGSSKPVLAHFPNTTNLLTPAQHRHMPPKDEPALQRSNSD